jgi:hypothetical protein
MVKKEAEPETPVRNFDTPIMVNDSLTALGRAKVIARFLWVNIGKICLITA